MASINMNSSVEALAECFVTKRTAEGPDLQVNGPYVAFHILNTAEDPLAVGARH